MQNLLSTIHQILNAVIPVMVALGVVYFVWGVVQYFIADAEEAKKTGKDRIIYGIIGLAVIVSLWGLVNLLAETFGLSGSSAPALASVNPCNIIGNGTEFARFSCQVTQIIASSVIPLLFALALVSFVWGVVKYFIIDADEEAKRAKGKQFMIWGIVALTVMLCVWGLVALLGGTFGLNINAIPLTNIVPR